jgi:hypothetical protein
LSAILPNTNQSGTAQTVSIDAQKAGELVVKTATLLVACYNPVPMEEPKLDPHFDKLPVLQRVTEVWRYQGEKMLYAISPMGGLQAWWKLTLLLFTYWSVVCCRCLYVSSNIDFDCGGDAGVTTFRRIVDVDGHLCDGYCTIGSDIFCHPAGHTTDDIVTEMNKLNIKRQSLIAAYVVF